MKTFKPLLGTCVLGLCALTFSVYAQTSATGDANNGAAATTSNGAANSTGAGTGAGTGMSGSTSNNGTGAAASGNTGSDSTTGSGSTMPMSGDQTNKHYDDEMKKCEHMTGDAKATCETQAKANRDGVKAHTDGTQTTPSSKP